MARIAFLVDGDYEDSEFQKPYDQLRESGHECVVVGTEAGKSIAGKKGSSSTKVEKAASECAPEDFDALVIPGGFSPDHLRLDQGSVALTRRFVESGKPVASICHAPQLLIEAEVVHGRRITSWPSVRKDLVNAGAEWVDEEVTTDRNLISSRKPDDLPAFIRAVEKAVKQPQSV